MAIAQNDLHRSLANMTVGFHRKVEARAHAADHYKLTEREQQFQIEVSGVAAAIAVEIPMTLTFSVYFVGDSGMQRASSQGPPQLRVGWEFTRRPAGLVPYTHVTEWVYDDGLNYAGCKMVAGAHYAGVVDPTLDMSFKGVLHVSFQGRGYVWDGDDDSSPDTTTS